MSLMGMVNAQALKDTNLIEIKATSTNPQLAADVANTVQQEYLKFISANNQEQMQNSVEFLENKSRWRSKTSTPPPSSCRIRRGAA